MLCLLTNNHIRRNEFYLRDFVISFKDTSIDVSGRVVDENGDPLVGANVTVKGTNKGTTTNLKGEFVIKDVNENAVLEISYVGYETQVISLKGQTLIISLNPKDSYLDETVVIAYGTTTKRFNTGNVSSVKASDIKKKAIGFY